MTGTPVGGLRVVLLGGFEIRLPSAEGLRLPTRKAQALLAYLAVRPGLAHPRDKLATLLWGDTAEEQARNSLRQALFHLRRSLLAMDGRALIVENDGIALDPGTAAVDVVAFERLAAQGTPEALEEAVALYRGELLEGFHLKEAAFEDWLRRERQRLREVAVGALETLLRHQTRGGAREAAIQTAIRLLALDPLQEAVHRALMHLYSGQGRRGMALEQYELCVTSLRRELGVQPEPATQRLYQEVLQQQRPDAGGGRTAEPAHTPGAARQRRLALPVHDAPMVGRQEQLARLRRVLDGVWRGRGTAVLIRGDAGIGKTRLVEELAGEAARRDGLVLLGRSYESERALPFDVWVNALRRGLAVSDIEALRGLDPVWRSALRRLLPELSAPASRGGRDRDDPLHLFEAVVELTRHLAASRPLLWCLEDLHWADDLSLRLLSFLIHRVQPWPVLIVGTARDEEIDDQGLLASLVEELSGAGCVEITLSPLTRPDTAALVRHLAPAGSPRAALSRAEAQAWTVSEGNPFVIVETMRALHDERLTETRKGSPAPAGSLPEKVRALIAGRLQRLSPRGRELVAVAAVIGREFDFVLLQRAAATFEPQEAAQGVEELVRRRILKGVGERFDFTHDRVRDVAYADLFPPRRRLLHRAVAGALEEMYGAALEPHYGALAVHYRQAGQPEEASRYVAMAGNLATTAFERGALKEAVAALEPALLALDPLTDSRSLLQQAIDLRVELRRSLVPLGELERIADLLREARSVAEQIGDERRSRQVDACRTHLCWAAGRYEEGIALGTDVMTAASAAGDTAARLIGGYYLAQCLHARGDYRRASAFLHGLEPAVRDRPHDRFGFSFAISIAINTWLSWSLAEMGQFDRAFAAAGDAIRVAEPAAQLYGLFHAYFALGVAHFERRDLAAAERVLGDASKLSEAGGFQVMRSFTTPYLAAVWAASGRIPDALSLAESGIAFSSSRGIGLAESLGLWQHGEVYLAAGDLERADQSALRALERSRRRGERGIEARVLRLLGAIEAGRSAERALEFYSAGRELASRLGMRPLVAHCTLELGDLRARTGDREQADEHRRAAASMYRDLEMDVPSRPS